MVGGVLSRDRKQNFIYRYFYTTFKIMGGVNTGKPLTNITESAGEISFCFISCSPGDR
jgi:hypothetical protein